MVKGDITMRTKLDIITNIQLVLWVIGGLLNFSILGNGRIIFLKQDGWNIRITGNGPIREGDISLMESVRYNIWSELNE